MRAAKQHLRFAALFVASCAPVLVDWVAKVLIWPRPFWDYYYDPEAIYFYGGLSLLRGRLPANVDNPGLPLHICSAMVAAITGPTPLCYARFLAVAHSIGFVLILTAIAFLLLTVFRGAPPLLAMVGSWTFFLAPQALERIDIWSPEILYFPLGVAIIAALWMRRAAAAGFAAGIAVATKWVFVPSIAAVVVAALSFSGIAAAAVAALSSAFGFLAGVCPAILSMDRLLHLVVNPNGQSWILLFMTSRAWIGWCIAVFVGTSLTYERRNRPVILFAVTLMALTLLGASKNPSFRYLLPTAMGVVALVASMASARPRLAVQIVFAAMAIVFMTKSVRDDIAAHRSRVANGQSVRQAIARNLPAGATVLYGWRAPVPSFALRIMASDARDLDAIGSAYPREGAFNPWTRSISGPAAIRRFDYLVMTPEDLRRFQGSNPIGMAGEFVIAAARNGGGA